MSISEVSGYEDAYCDTYKTEEPDNEQQYEIASKVWAVVRAIIFFPCTIFDCLFPRNPVTQCREFRLIPACLERFVGRILYGNLLSQSGGEVSPTDARYGKYVQMVNEIGQSLAAQCPRKDLDFEFAVVGSGANNAWCLPGGKIAINLGIILNMENETNDYRVGQFTLREKIAAVLGHEINHAAARHWGRALELRIFLASIVLGIGYIFSSWMLGTVFERKIEEARKRGDYARVRELTEARSAAFVLSIQAFAKLASWICSGIGLCKSRSHELEADKYGMYLVWDTAKTGATALTPNSARASIWLQHFFDQTHKHRPDGCWGWFTNFFSTHPDPKERIEANERTWKELTLQR